MILNKKKIHIIVGARPNFIKIYKLLKILDRSKQLEVFLVHTGQHYTKNLSDIFFSELKIRKPDFKIKSGSGSHAEQHSKVMLEYQKIINKNYPNLCIVVGDVNSTISCSLIAKKNNIKVAHIESGLRSYDFSMPEEINRVLTDRLSDYHFVTLKSGKDNLIKEGVKKNKIYHVGNTMIDTLIHFKPYVNKLTHTETNEKYIILTLHRPINVDNKKVLNNIIKKVTDIFNEYKIIFPVHPRTYKKLSTKLKNIENLLIVSPMSYLKFISYVKKSFCIITDSGGISEETTFLNIPCITIRENTERPETVSVGTNVLIKNDLNKLYGLKKKLINKNWKKSKKILKWDGFTSKRIAKIIETILNR